MELLDKLYKATTGGLDVICWYYPEARDCSRGDSKKFRIRQSDRTPSASLYSKNEVWYVTDFGGEGKALSPIDLAMEQEGRTFMETLLLLADRFQIDNGYTPSINKPDIRKRPASKEEKEGGFEYKMKEFTPEELAILGPKVTAEICKTYSFVSLSEYSKTNKNKETGTLETTTFRSSDNYPIFMRDCGEFQKIYKPCVPDNGYRFFYAGTKPKDFVNGLSELTNKYRLLNKKTDEGEEQKLGEAIICSGERDALNVAAMGGFPIWLNSETAKLPPKEYNEIRRMVDALYNIPDIDGTGLCRGKELALQYPEILTIWLPDWLQNFKDRRGKARKDFRDWIELRPTSFDFNNLLKSGRNCQFWEYVKTDKGLRLEINSSNLLNFLYCSGFGTITNAKNEIKYVRVVENRVEEVNSIMLRRFLKDHCVDRHLPIDIHNLILNSRRIGEGIFSMLRELTLNFKDYDNRSQHLFFDNAVWKIDNTGTTDLKWKDSKVQVWNEEVLPIAVKRLAPSFSINQKNNDFSIEILNNQSAYFRYLINTSRIHWRAELEERVDQLATPEEYRQANKFNLFGPLLSEQEQQEQATHLINKIFAIGYLLHRYKSPDRAWCVFAMDGLVDENGESNGGSGKSFCFKSLMPLMKTDILDGRNPRLSDNSHVYERIDEFTDLVIVDECSKSLDFNFFYSSITGTINVNPKNNRSYVLSFEQTPKFAFCSNYTVRMENSTNRRILYTVFSDYYHDKGEKNNYRETRKISDDFGRNLFDSQYKNEDWNLDINFFVDCLQFYLSTVGSSIKIDPPMRNVIERSNIALMGENFYQWAVVYFGPDSDNLDTFISRAEAFATFCLETKVKGMAIHSFTKKLHVFAQWAPWIECYQPREYQNDAGRIIRKNLDNKACDMIYLRSRKQHPCDDDKPF